MQFMHNHQNEGKYFVLNIKDQVQHNLSTTITNDHQQCGF